MIPKVFIGNIALDSLLQSESHSFHICLHISCRVKTASRNLCSLATSVTSLEHLLCSALKLLLYRKKLSKAASRVCPSVYWAETCTENTAVSFKSSYSDFLPRKKECCVPKSHSGTGLGCGQGTHLDLKDRMYYWFSSLVWHLNKLW